LEKEDMKKIAAEKAVEYVEDDMIIGLGTGSTVAYAIKKLGEKIKKGLRVEAVPTSQQTKKLAAEQGVPLIELDESTIIDLTIDGADEVDSELNLIKGGGGALTREKIVAYHSERVVIVIDESKIVKRLGCDFPVPVEVVRFGWSATKKAIEGLGGRCELRRIMNEVYITDNQHYIIDCDFGPIDAPEDLDVALHNIPGVIETGLFIGLADEVIVGSNQGVMKLGGSQE